VHILHLKQRVATRKENTNARKNIMFTKKMNMIDVGLPKR